MPMQYDASERGLGTIMKEHPGAAPAFRKALRDVEERAERPR
jgi:hypothetical protein